MIHPPGAVRAPIPLAQILLRYTPRVHRMDRKLGLSIVLINRSDVPGALEAMHPAHLCWGMLFPFPTTRTDVSWPRPPIARIENEIARRAYYRHGFMALSFMALERGYPLDEPPLADLDAGIDEGPALETQAWLDMRESVLLDAVDSRHMMVLNGARPLEMVHTALNWENEVWRSFDDARMARIWESIAPLMLTGPDRWRRKNDHWLWRGATHTGYPATSFGTSKHVPVVRLLWATYRNDPPLYDGKGPVLRPHRDKRKCIEPMCVNPEHFEPSIPVRLARDPTAVAYGNSSRTGALPPRNHHWTITSPSQPDPHGVFERLVLCKQGHPLGNATQIAYNRALKGGSPTSGTGHCTQCYKQRRKAGQQVYRRPYKGQPVDTNLMQQAKDMFKDTPLYPGPQPEPEPEADPFEAFSEGRSEPGFNVHGPYDVDEIEDLFKDIGDNNPA